MSKGADSANTLAGKLADYAYSPSSAQKKNSLSNSNSAPVTPVRAGSSAGGPSTGSPLRRSARKATSRSPYFQDSEEDDEEAEDDDYANDSHSDSLVELSDAPSTPSKTPRRSTSTSAKGTPTPSRKKLGWKKPRGFADPEKYAHLSNVEDCVGPNLDRTCAVHLPR